MPVNVRRGGAATGWNLPGDPLCTALAGGIGTYDAARLEIVFTLLPGADGIGFDFIVGSEEWPEYVGQVNDVAGSSSTARTLPWMRKATPSPSMDRSSPATRS
jgi:hypothetical protein